MIYHPSFIVFILAVICLAIELYYVFKKRETLKKLSKTMQWYFFISLPIAAILILWYVIHIIITMH